MDNCIFCKIIKGEVPSYKIYENEGAIAFLDVNPLGRGHTLVVPKKHFQNMFKIEEQDLKYLLSAVQEAGKIIKEKLGPTGINILQRNGKGAGQEVSHMHFHLVPRFDGDSVALPPRSEYKEEDIENTHKLLTDFE